MAVKRVSSGIKGLDKLIEGGFPEGNVILYTGEPGTGKTIAALQFLVKNSTTTKKGLYVTLEQSNHDLMDQASQFGWNLEQLNKQKKLSMLYLKSSGELVDLFTNAILHTSSGLMEFLSDFVQKNKVGYIVLDSISDLKINSKLSEYMLKKMNIKESDITERHIEKAIFEIIENFKSMPVTTIITAAKTDSDKLTTDNVSPFCADGIVLMNFHKEMIDEKCITIEPRKMRQTAILRKPIWLFFRNGIGIDAVEE